MERPKREASAKVGCYKKFHLSGDLSHSLQGRVAELVTNLQSPVRPNEGSDNIIDKSTPGSQEDTGTHVQNKQQSINAPGSPELAAPRSIDTTDNAFTPRDNSSGATLSITHCTQINTTINAHTPDSTGKHNNIQQVQEGHSSDAHPSHSTSGNQGSMSDMEKLKQELEQQKQQNAKLQLQLDEMRLRSEIEVEKQKEVEWAAAISKVKELKEQTQQSHLARMEKIKNTTGPVDNAGDGDDPTSWMHRELFGDRTSATEVLNSEEERRRQEAEQEQTRSVRALMDENTALRDRAMQLIKDNPAMKQDLAALPSAITDARYTSDKDNPPDSMIQQLRLALSTKQTNPGDWQKDMLKQFLTNTNKVTGPGGATTLKPDILKRITEEDDEFNMADWLSRLNRQEIGESMCEDNLELGCKHGKLKSGMLDKAATNIVHKEVWPQRNLMEDWADEDMDFKQLQFEHHIAGEVRTIETCTHPAEILGRLRLLRRMAYARLRGYDWPMVRKMYAAILRSIEAKEYTWESNFDRFEAILYRRPPVKAARSDNEPRRNEVSQKKWFCREWNKGEGCSKTSPHRALFGTGPNAIPRMVVHICAACYMKDRAQRDHPEGHESCPHRT